MGARLVRLGELNRLRRPWQIDTHRHSFTQVVCFLKGRGYVVVGNEEYNPQEGSLLIYRPTVLHKERSDPYIGQHTSWLVLEGANYDDLPTHFQDTTGEIRWLFSALLREKKRASTSTALASSYFVALSNLLNNNQNQASWIELVQLYIYQRFRESSLTLNKLSMDVGISTSSITHGFQRHLGVTASRYILQLRLSEAQALLGETDLPISLISSRVGFSDPCYFATKFRLEYNQSPGDYRRRVQQQKLLSIK